MDKKMTTNGVVPYRLSENPDDKLRAGRPWTFEEHAELGDLIIEYYRVGGLRPIKESTYREWGKQMGRSPAALAYKASERGLTYTNFTEVPNAVKPYTNPDTVPPLATKTEPADSKPSEVDYFGGKTVLDLPLEWLHWADRLAEDLNCNGRYLAFGRMTRETVLRLAVQRGLRHIDAHSHG